MKTINRPNFSLRGTEHGRLSFFIELMRGYNTAFHKPCRLQYA